MTATLPLSDRPFIADSLAYHRRDAQHDAAGWRPETERCHECGQPLNDDRCPVCGTYTMDPDPDADPSVYEAGEPVDPDLVGDHGINEVW